MKYLFIQKNKIKYQSTTGSDFLYFAMLRIRTLIMILLEKTILSQSKYLDELVWKLLLYIIVS